MHENVSWLQEVNCETITIFVYFWKLYPATEKWNGDSAGVGSLMEDEVELAASATGDTASSTGVHSVFADADDCVQHIVENSSPVCLSMLALTAADIAILLLPLSAGSVAWHVIV